MTRRLMILVTWMATSLAIVSAADAQGRRGATAPPPSPKDAAQYDLTGYWVSVVTEDWRWRMFTPPKGDYAGVPLNAAGRALADAWDPAADEAADEACKAYGAPGALRLPGRLHITWQDDETLKIETDTGTQTRLLSFGTPHGTPRSWQGVSRAAWESLQPSTEFSARGAGLGEDALASAVTLKVVTTDLRSGYIRKNGVPYSEDAVLTEYFDVVEPEEGLSYLVVSATLEDPAHLTEPMLTAVHFRKQPSASGWNPTPCKAM